MQVRLLRFANILYRYDTTALLKSSYVLRSKPFSLLALARFETSVGPSRWSTTAKFVAALMLLLHIAACRQAGGAHGFASVVVRDTSRMQVES